MSSAEVRLPQPDEISDREKEDAMGAYFMMFAALGLGFPLPLINLIASLIYFVIHRRKSRFVAFHALQSLISHLPVAAFNVALIVWLLWILATTTHFASEFFVFLVFVAFANILYIVYCVVALTRARKGQLYYMPFFGRLCYATYYGPNARSMQKPVEPNRPPQGFTS
jgi:uncharacterized Tic20 family protein